MNVTINRLNWKQVPALVKLLAGRVAGITIQFYYPYEGTEDLRLGHSERRQVLDELIHLTSSSRWPMTWCQGPS